MAVQVRVVPDHGAKPTVTKLAEGVALQTALIDCKVRLFVTGLSITDSVGIAALEAAEATFSGYPTDGIEVEAVGEPYLNGNGSVLVTVPLVQFNHVVGSPNVENTVAGAWVENAAGALMGVVVFEDPVDMATNGDSIPVVISFRIGTSPDEA